MCGGASSRMRKEVGKDKALMPFGSFDTLIEYQVSKLQNLFANFYISSKTIKTSESTHYIFDSKSVRGTDTDGLFAPTLSLYSSLLRFNEPLLFIPIDMPLVSALTLKKLIDTKISNKCDAVVLRVNEKPYPTCAIYDPKVLPILEDMIINNRHKLQLFLGEIDTIYVDFETSDEFTNINTFSDYERLTGETNTSR